MPERSTFSLWIQAVRAPFFTAAVVPVILGVATSMLSDSPLYWPALPLMLLCTVCLQAGTNLINDYYDFRKGVDTPSSFGSSRVLVDKLLEPGRLLRAGYLFFGAGLLLGLSLVALRGTALLLIGISGLAAGYAYTGRPLGLKYAGLGDLIVFLFMGPAIVVGTHLALTGSLSAHAAYASLPVALLVTAILHANNTRDISSDRAAGITTFAGRLGLKAAILFYRILVMSAYAGIIIMTALGILPPACLAVFAGFPQALRVMKYVGSAKLNDPRSIAAADVLTAQLHLTFGLLYAVSLLLWALFR